MPLYNNRHYDRGDMLITTLIAVDANPGLKSSELACIVTPEQAEKTPEYIGWWFGSYLKKWHKSGFFRRGYSSKKKRAALRYFLTNKGIEVLLSLGVKRA